jgi:hypothetical protein
VRTRLTRALTVLVTGAALITAGACKPLFGGPEDVDPDPEVWGIDVILTSDMHGAGGGGIVYRGGTRLEIQLTVLATLCGSQPLDVDSNRGYTYGHSCKYLFSESDVAAQTPRPDLRVGELKATAHLTVFAEYGSERVGAPLFEGDVGPLAMGAPIDLELMAWNFDKDRPAPANPGPVPDAGRHRAHAIVTNCHLTNGSACANNSRRFFMYQETGSSSQALTVPDQAGSLVKQEAPTAAPGSGEQPGQTGQTGPVGGLAVSRTVSGVYKAGSGLGRVSFWGAEFAAPQAPDAVGSAVIEEAFGRAGLAGGAGFAPTSEMRRHDAGPLGGQVWCQTFKYQVLKTTTFYACGWMDRATVGAVIINDHAAEHLGLNEARAAALLVAMRKDIEKAS